MMDKRVLMVLFPVAVLALLLPGAAGREVDHKYHVDANQCRRMKKHDNVALLDSTNGQPAIKHFEDGAFVHKMSIVESDKNTAACKDPNNWGYDSDKVTVWAKNGCKAEFLVGYVQAFCGEVTIDSTYGYKERKMSDMNNPCYDNAAAYNMKLITEMSGKDVVVNGKKHHESQCGLHKDANGNIAHEGLGYFYGFHHRTVWADYGCWAKFEVCEVGTKMDHDMI